MAEYRSRPAEGSSDARPRERDNRPDRDKKRRFQVRKKVCRFCVDKTPFVDYKDSKLLRLFITERGKILPRRISGACSRHQREVTTAVKRARNIALLPFSGDK